VTQLPGSESGPCFADSHSPRPPPFAPPAPPRIAPLCSSASQLLWRGLTPHVRASSATALFAPSRCGPDGNVPVVGRGVSRFPRTKHACMPGSSTTPGRPSACVDALGHSAFHYTDSVGTRNQFSIAAQWLACTFPCRRFADILTDGRARLGADVVRYSFIVVDLHHLLLAGLPAHLCKNVTARDSDRMNVSLNRNYSRRNS
jgi:hypothetical protein